jgi:hypothetical protein
VNLSLGTTNARDAVAVSWASVNVRFSPRWSVRFWESYDFRRGDMIEAGLKIRRVLHCWVLEAGVVYDRGENNTSFVFSFLPKLFASESEDLALRF